LPSGEIAEVDSRHTGYAVPVDRDARREAFGLEATLPHSAAHSTWFTFSRATPGFCAAVVGCFVRLVGMPEKAVTVNEATS
jgi:hypothetical protein